MTIQEILALIGIKLPDNRQKRITAKDVRDSFQLIGSKVEAISSGYKDYLKIADTAPTGGWIKGLYKLLEIGDYINLTPAVDSNGNPTTIKGEASKINEAYFNGTNWTKSEIVIPPAEKKIDTWVAGNYDSGVQKIKMPEEAVYESITSVTASDIPGVSSKWERKIGGGEATKGTFTNIVKFDQKKKYSTINQSGDINFVLDTSGTEKNAIDRREIVSDGIGNLNFSTDFEVIGIDKIDKSKNQLIMFSRQSLVEFKPLAIIINIAKSGQETPIDLEPDALLYVNRIIAAGGTLSKAHQSAINNFFLSAKSDGYFSKLKGVWLAMGSNTNSRLVNAITGAPAGTMLSGVISSNGIEGVMDSNMKPSDIFTLSSFSYGFNNSTAIYTTNQSMGCRVSSTSGITCTPTAASPSGQFFFSGPNNDVYGNTPNADSIGTYIISRTGTALAKAFKNKAILFTHSASQGSATLPNINFYISGFNNNGSIVDDTRVLKWAFLGSGLTDTEAVNITTNFDNLMLAISR